MGIHALKQVIHDAKQSLDHGPRHMHVGMPSLFKKHSNRIHKMRKEFQDIDRDAAKRANAEAKATGRPKPYKMKKSEYAGAGDQDFRDHVADEVLDNVKKAYKEIKGGGDFQHKVREAGKDLVKGINSHRTRLQLMRTYLLAVKGELEGKVKDAGVNGAAAALYEVYLADTPAAEALPFESDDPKEITFSSIVKEGYGLGDKAKDLPKPIDGHTF